MKSRIAAAAAAAVAIGSVTAQLTAYPAVSTTISITPTSSPASTLSISTSASQSYVTVTYSDCPSQSIATMTTVTNGITVTYCPECNNVAPSSSKPASPGHTTIYTTTYYSLCPTGLVPATYTVTESCAEATPSWASETDHIPSGFTVTTKTCSTGCGKTPMPVTITEPCGCEATSGVPVTQPNAAPTSSPAPPPPASGALPAGSAPPVGPPAGGAPPTGDAPPAGDVPPVSASHTTAAIPASSTNTAGDNAPISQISDGQIEAPPTTPVPGRVDSNGAIPPYPTTAAAGCPGPQCGAIASTAPSGADYGNTTGVQQWTGAASAVGTTSLVSSICMAAAIAALAFAL